MDQERRVRALCWLPGLSTGCQQFNGARAPPPGVPCSSHQETPGAPSPGILLSGTLKTLSHDRLGFQHMNLEGDPVQPVTPISTKICWDGLKEHKIQLKGAPSDQSNFSVKINTARTDSDSLAKTKLCDSILTTQYRGLGV